LSAADIALAPFDKAVFDIAKMELPSCPNANTLTMCGTHTLAAALYGTRPIMKDYLDINLPLSAWVISNAQLREAIERFPYYKAMRERIYDEAVPKNSYLRYGPGNGPKSGKLKPLWVVELQEKNRKEREGFHWMRPL